MVCAPHPQNWLRFAIWRHSLFPGPHIRPAAGLHPRPSNQHHRRPDSQSRSDPPHRRKPPRTGNVRISTADTSGIFIFNDVPPGKYIISAQRNGFVSQNRGRPAIQSISVTAGQDVSGISIKLTPHSIVTGKVLDEDGEPMFGAAVNIMEERYFRGRRTLSARGSGTVNDLGEYRIAGLQPGRYFVAVQPRGDYGPAPFRVRPPGRRSTATTSPSTTLAFSNNRRPRRSISTQDTKHAASIYKSARQPLCMSAAVSSMTREIPYSEPPLPF